MLRLLTFVPEKCVLRVLHFQTDFEGFFSSKIQVELQNILIFSGSLPTLAPNTCSVQIS